MAVVELIFDLKAPAWVTGNTNVPKNGEPVFLTDGRYAFGDGVTQVQALTFYGGATSDLESVLTAGNTTGTKDIILSTGTKLYIGDSADRHIEFDNAGIELHNFDSSAIVSVTDTGYFKVNAVQYMPNLTASRLLSLNASQEVITETGTGFLTLNAGVISYDNSSYQPLDADLTSWANVTRASGFDTFAATPSSANLAALVTDETGSGALVFGTSPTFTTDITTPLIIGGTAVGSTIQYKGTTGNGTSTVEAHQFLVGNNGNVTALKIFNSGIVQGITIYATSNVNAPVIYGGTTASQNLTLSSTEHATKGRVLIGSSSIFNFDQTNIRFGIGVNPDSSLHIKTAGGANLGAKIETTGASTYAPIDFQTPTGLAGQFLATSASFSSGIFSGNQLALASYVANGVLIASSYGFKVATGGLLTTNEAFSIDANANIICGRAAIATSATNGFLYVPTCAGTPTGVPTTVTGRVPLVADSTNNKLYIYSGGAWVALN